MKSKHSQTPQKKPLHPSRNQIVSQYLLKSCDAIWRVSYCLGWGFRGGISVGLAYLLAGAYSAQGTVLKLDGEALRAFISNSVAEWYRCRNFPEWFCQDAAGLFHKARPSDLAEILADQTCKKQPQGKKKARKKKPRFRLPQVAGQ
jgi:hypothetical protein